MKLLSLLAPVLNLLKNFGFLYRIIGLGICVIFFNSNIKDLFFLAQSSEAKTMTIEEIIQTPKSEIPRYLRIENVALASDAYVATQDEESGKILDASFPVYSLEQLSRYDTLNPLSLMTHVIVKDKNFNEDSLNLFMDIEGKHDNESFDKVMNILASNEVNVSADAILIVKEKPPSFNSSLLWSVLTGLFGLLILLSFIPSTKLAGPAQSAPPPNESRATPDEDEFV